MIYYTKSLFQIVSVTVKWNCKKDLVTQSINKVIFFNERKNNYNWMQWTFSETQSLIVEVEFWYFFNKTNKM